MTHCKRCRAPFTPHKLDAVKLKTAFCEPCRMRNVLDGLGLPTPPCLIDPHTKVPALTIEEFWEKLER